MYYNCKCSIAVLTLRCDTIECYSNILLFVVLSLLWYISMQICVSMCCNLVPSGKA